MRKLIVPIAAFAVVVVAALTPALAASKTETAAVKVAILVPTTGDFAPHNTLVANGAQIAADESGDAKGPVGATRITLQRTNLAPDANPAQVMSSLAADHVTAVILPCNVDSVPSLARAGSQAGLLMLLPCDPDPKAVLSIPLVWPTAMGGNAEVAQLVTYARVQNARHPYLITTSGSAYVDELSNYFRASTKLNGLTMAGESSVPLNGGDIAGLAASIKKAKPDAIFTALFSPYVERVVAGLHAHGIIAPIYVTDGMDADQHLDHWGAKLNNSNYATFGFSRPGGGQFGADYTTAFHKVPSGSFPGLGYEAIRVLEAAMTGAGTTSATGINAQFEKGFTVTGAALGDVRYGGKNQRLPFTDAGVARIVGGAVVPLFSSDPSISVRIPAP
jgi:ABC-type branched-subunit amino acid transport system substrate-binding protein